MQVETKFLPPHDYGFSIKWFWIIGINESATSYAELTWDLVVIIYAQVC